jgi:FkbM family methyltransferase
MNKIEYSIKSISDECGDKKYAFIKNDMIYSHIERYGSWEPYFSLILSQILNPGDECLDIGANFGYHTISMAHVVENSGKVYAFEPIRVIFQQLNCNVFLNGLTNVNTYNLAVGENTRRISVPNIDFLGDSKNYGDTSLDYNKTDNVVGLVKVDDFKFDNLKFIKVDIQGMELLCLRGAKETIKKFKPVMIIEVEEFRFSKYNYTKDELFNFIKNDCEYKIYQIDSDYPVDHICIHNSSDINTKLFGVNLIEV